MPTVLQERGIPFGQSDDLPHLFRTVASTLPFLPVAASAESEIRSSLTQTISGLHTAIQEICELRNQGGFASHGSGDPRPAMESVQALLAAEAADTIVGFLHRVHRQDRTPPPSPRALFEANWEFNLSVDEAHGTIRIFEAEFQPSEVLFEMEPETYRVFLSEFVVDDGDETGSPESTT